MGRMLFQHPARPVRISPDKLLMCYVTIKVLSLTVDAERHLLWRRVVRQLQIKSSVHLWIATDSLQRGHPMTINYIAVLCAAIAAWIAGAIWYSVLGNRWKAALGWSDAEIESRAAKLPVGPMIISFVAELLMAVLLAGLIGHFGAMTIRTGAIVGGLCWLAFVATTIGVNNAYAGRSPWLTLIDSGHWLAVLLIEGVVIGAFG
jgi:hypothetical protein